MRAAPPTTLTIVPPELTIAVRVQRLQAEAKGLAIQHVEELLAAMRKVETIANDVSTGGEVYPAGIRDLARRLVEHIETNAQAIEAIGARGEASR